MSDEQQQQPSRVVDASAALGGAATLGQMSGHSQARTTAIATAQGWIYLSGPLMQAAAAHSRTLAEIEATYTGRSELPARDHVRHRSAALSGLVMAASALEAFANQPFLNVLATPTTVAAALPFDAANTKFIRDKWDAAYEKKPTIDKVQLALERALIPKFSNTDPLIRAASTALELRNQLVHYKAKETTGTPLPKHKALEDELQNFRFAPNPFALASPTLFPMKCLGHGCVAWAIESYMNLLEAFCRKMRMDDLSRAEWQFQYR